MKFKAKTERSDQKKEGEHMVRSIVEALAEEGYNVGKIDVDQEMGLAQQFKVMSIPTILIFKGGQEVHRLVGLTSKEDLKKLLDE